MNREIKFRAWDSIAGKMWEDVYFDGGHIYTIGPDGENASTMPRWEDNAIMQFTGLLDKNGKEIYESDILSDETNELFFVSWHEAFASFAIYKKGWAFAHFFQEGIKPDEVQVIGNIYENKELLG